MSTDGTTLTFTPDDPLAANTSYTLVVPTGSVRDRAGNLLKGSTTVQFTTADEFPSGEISGVVSGHVGTQAANPEGAIAVAPTRTPFVESEEDDLPINGTDVVDATGAYSITRLPDGWYFPFAIMDSNNDGTLDPERGDAIGAYGADIAQGDFEVDSVDVVTIPPSPPSLSVDFPLFDPVAIAGTASYVGTAYKDSLVEISFYVGVFDTAGFDPVNPTPLYQTSSEIAFMPRFALSTLNDAGLMPGTYYVGGFMDTWPPGHDPNDPAVWWGGFPPVPVTIEGGADRLDINLTFTDTSMGGGGNSPVMWVQDKSLARGKDNEAKARFMAYASRIAEQLNRRK